MGGSEKEQRSVPLPLAAPRASPSGAPVRVCTRTHSSGASRLPDQVKKLEDDRSALQSAKAGLEDENKTLKQKVEILNELYQQKEMALQK